MSPDSPLWESPLSDPRQVCAIPHPGCPLEPPRSSSRLTEVAGTLGYRLRIEWAPIRRERVHTYAYSRSCRASVAIWSTADPGAGRTGSRRSTIDRGDAALFNTGSNRVGCSRDRKGHASSDTRRAGARLEWKLDVRRVLTEALGKTWCCWPLPDLGTGSRPHGDLDLGYFSTCRGSGVAWAFLNFCCRPKRFADDKHQWHHAVAAVGPARSSCNGNAGPLRLFIRQLVRAGSTASRDTSVRHHRCGWVLVASLPRSNRRN